MWRREPEKALEFLHSVPEDYLEDVYFTGPKLVLSASAQLLAGHDEAARADLTNALSVLDARGYPNEPSRMVVRCEYWRGLAARVRPRGPSFRLSRIKNLAGETPMWLPSNFSFFSGTWTRRLG